MRSANSVSPLSRGPLALLILVAVVVYLIHSLYQIRSSPSQWSPSHETGFGATISAEHQLRVGQPAVPTTRNADDKRKKPSEQQLKAPGPAVPTSDDAGAGTETPSAQETKSPEPALPTSITQSTTSSEAYWLFQLPPELGDQATMVTTLRSLKQHPNSTIPLRSPPPTRTSHAVSQHHIVESPQRHSTFTKVQVMVRELISHWNPPSVVGHWPPYDAYHDKTYDPNAWEGFPWNLAFYANNGIARLKDQPSAILEPFATYPSHFTSQWKEQWHGMHVACEGLRGKLLNESDEDVIKIWQASPHDFPRAAIGDITVIGAASDQCADRYNRYGPYGYGQAERGQVSDWDRPIIKPDWQSTRWQNLQDQCLIANADRFAPTVPHPRDMTPATNFSNGQMAKDSASEGGRTVEDGQTVNERLLHTPKAQYHHRTVLLIRTWEGYTYTENDLQTIRALITELGLLSGGEYQVSLLVYVSDKSADIWNDHEDVLKQSVPRELQSIAILWNERICEEWYPKIGCAKVEWHRYMPLQWFSKIHPEFNFVWDWQMDVRYTGNHYQFLEAVGNFSRDMPRKYLWEHNQRFYIPAVHGTYEDWLNNTNEQIEKAMREDGLRPIWGPRPYDEIVQEPIGPRPAMSMADDALKWGVGEQADYITLQPIFDPNQTEWKHKNEIWNFIPGVTPDSTAEDPEIGKDAYPEYVDIPRRASISTLARFSKRQLHAMHLENMAGRAMQADMWPATVALHHGCKAVYVPQPVWADREWPAWYVDAVFNADGGESAQWGQRSDSVYNRDRSHNFAGWSSAPASEFPDTLYRRWMGWKIPDGSPLSDAIGGKEYEEGGGGRMCLPPMLLHPVKKVEEKDEENSVIKGATR